MTGTKKLDWFLAVYVGDSERYAEGMWDMLRYDRCYPTSNTHDEQERGWIILTQPYVPGLRGGFRLDRWSSFGFRTVLVASAPTQTGVPWRFRELIQETTVKMTAPAPLFDEWTRDHLRKWCTDRFSRDQIALADRIIVWMEQQDPSTAKAWMAEGWPTVFDRYAETTGDDGCTVLLDAFDKRILATIGKSTKAMRMSALTPTRRHDDRMHTLASVDKLYDGGLIALVSDEQGRDTYRITTDGRRALNGQKAR